MLFESIMYSNNIDTKRLATHITFKINFFDFNKGDFSKISNWPSDVMWEGNHRDGYKYIKIIVYLILHSSNCDYNCFRAVIWTILVLSLISPATVYSMQSLDLFCSKLSDQHTLPPFPPIFYYLSLFGYRLQISQHLLPPKLRSPWNTLVKIYVKW